MKGSVDSSMEGSLIQKKNETSVKFCFDKEIVTAIKGMAILILLFHHLFGSPSWLENSISFFSIRTWGGESLEILLAGQGKMCIAIYTVLSGYGLYISFSKRNRKFDWKYALDKDLKLLIIFFLVYLFTQLPFDMVSGDYSNINPINNSFLTFYLIAIWTYPLWMCLLKKMKCEYVWCFIIPILGMAVREGLSYIGIVDGVFYTYILYLPFLLTGGLLYKSNLFGKLYDKFSLYKPIIGKVVGVMLILISIILRFLLKSHALSFDAWVAVIFIFGLSLLLQGKHRCFYKPLYFMGKHSTNLWFEHTFLIVNGYFIQRIVYAPYIPVIILAWAVLLCLPVSFLINWIMKVYSSKNLMGLLEKR